MAKRYPEYPLTPNPAPEVIQALKFWANGKSVRSSCNLVAPHFGLTGIKDKERLRGRVRLVIQHARKNPEWCDKVLVGRLKIAPTLGCLIQR